MMGPAQRSVPRLFYTQFNLEERIRPDHPLRAIRGAVDFDFVRRVVKPLYGQRGNRSVDPAVLLKLMFLLFYEQVPSERALMARMPERLDWLWFCGFDLDSELPDHSVLSKARRRWGRKAFEEFFVRILAQCIEAELVDGGLEHADSSLIRANADQEKLRVALRLAGGRLYERLEETAGADGVSPGPAEPGAEEDEAGGEGEEGGPGPVAPGTLVSPTDPEARLTRKSGRSVLGYKDHRVVDDRCGIITATITTDAAAADPHLLGELLDQHEANTGQPAETVVADMAYGTADNYKDLASRGMTPCIAHQRRNNEVGDKFRRGQFVYDRASDTFRCPGGQVMHPGSRPASDGRWRYRAGRGVCAACPLRRQCTDNPNGRQVSRDVDQDVIDWADTCLPGHRRRHLMRRRKIRAEGSFADATNRHGYKRARWRGLVRVTIQNLLIATIQNLRKLIRWNGRPGRSAARMARVGAVSGLAFHGSGWTSVVRWFRRFMTFLPAPAALQPPAWRS